MAQIIIEIGSELSDDDTAKLLDRVKLDLLDEIVGAMVGDVSDGDLWVEDIRFG
jgi:hypothetical protein